MDIYTLIHHDHETARKLIMQINTLDDNSYSDRISLFQQLKEEILSHNYAEAGSFYLALAQAADMSREYRRSLQEHMKINDMIDKLSLLFDMGIAIAAWKKTFAEFQDIFLHHIDKEEEEIFSVAHNIISQTQASQLVRTMVNLKSAKRELEI